MSQKLRVDVSKLLGFRLNPASAINGTAGLQSKIGSKVGSKPGFKPGSAR
jgi:hypothetical protein